MKRIFAHTAIVLALFYLVLFVIDKLNMFMEFINNDTTKLLILLLAAVSAINAVAIIRSDRKAQLKQYKKQQQLKAEKRKQNRV